MIIAAALCWYDEEPRILRRCIMSLAGIADVLVALDGPYADYPTASPESPLDQRDAIEGAASDAGIEIVALSWPGLTQAAKRTALYREAARRADWLLIIDADETLHVNDATELRARLTPAHDAASIVVITDEHAAPYARLIRSMDDLTCGPVHHGALSATDDGERVCIADRRGEVMHSKPRPRRARVDDVSDLAIIINHTDDRPQPRIDAKCEYIAERTRLGRDQ